MKTIKFWSLMVGLVIVSACSIILIIGMKFISALAGAFFMDSISAKINEHERSFMKLMMFVFDRADKIVDNKKKVNPAESFTAGELKVLEELRIWEQRQKNKKYRVIFKTSYGVELWACIIIEHCESCAIAAAMDENGKRRFVVIDDYNCVLAVADFLGDVS